MFALSDWHSWGIGDLAIFIIIVAALIAIVYIAVQAFGAEKIPSWVKNIFWVVLVAAVAIIAVRIVLSL
jgi:hypothetical protein